jgi:C1A family cysteine protease
MPQLDVTEIHRAILERGASWIAQEHPLLLLSSDAQRRRLGVIVDHDRLNALRRQPYPDLPQVVAKFLLRQSDIDDKTLAGASQTVKDILSLQARTALVPALSQFPWWSTAIDWRNHCGRNYVTSIKDQGNCGSCVAFGTVATLESMLLIERQMAFDLSEAELLFCGGGSCGGWWPDSAISYLTTRGVSYESCFPYEDHDMPCCVCPERDAEAITIRDNVVLLDVSQRKQYLAFVGPMVAVFEVFAVFFAYHQGVYQHLVGPSVGFHCVEVIGYNDCQKCWICKNSWGPGWGTQGYFRIEYGQCQIDSTFPFWGISQTQWWS